MYGLSKIIENVLILNIDETGLFLNLGYNNAINKTVKKVYLLIKWQRKDTHNGNIRYNCIRIKTFSIYHI